MRVIIKFDEERHDKVEADINGKLKPRHVHRLRLTIGDQEYDLFEANGELQILSAHNQLVISPSASNSIKLSHKK